MCMMIWHPEDAEPFTRKEFADFHQHNPHGFGAIWISRGELRYVKGRYNLAQTWNLYKRLRKNKHKAVALHWRFATAGGKDHGNCHPFLVNDVLLMHNGVLQHRSTKTLSDTQCFIRDELKDYLHSGILDDERWTEWLDRKIGYSNKMLLWGATDDKPIIVGEKKGLWHRGRWYSNTYAWDAPRTVYTRGYEYAWGE